MLNPRKNANLIYMSLIKMKNIIVKFNYNKLCHKM